MTTTVDGAIGLHDRKKLQTRRAILDSAAALFAERGYGNVTVAEIADTANISVKTLFAYFRSKEDLAFSDAAALRDELVVAVRERPSATSVADAVSDVLHRMIDNDGADQLRTYRKQVAESDALRSRLLRVWDECETALALQLLDEFDGPLGPSSARLAANILVALVRSLSSAEVLEFVETKSKRKKAMRGWVDAAVDLVNHGLRNLPSSHLVTGSPAELERLRLHRIEWT